MRGSRSPPRATNSKPYGRERGLDGCASQSRGGAGSPLRTLGQTYSTDMLQSGAWRTGMVPPEGASDDFSADRLQTFPSSPSASPPAHRTAAFIAPDRPRSERDRVVLAPMTGRLQGRRCGLTPDDGVAHAEAPSSQVATLPRTFALRGPLPARSQLVESSALAPQTLPSSKYCLTEHRPARGVRPDQRGG